MTELSKCLFQCSKEVDNGKSTMIYKGIVLDFKNVFSKHQASLMHIF